MATTNAQHLLITGARGYLASHFLQEAGTLFKKVTALHRSFDASASYPPTMRHLYHDICSLPDSALEDIDVVIHLAGYRPAARLGHQTFETSHVQATEHLASLCATRAIPLLFVSTGSVYGGIDGKPRAEMEVRTSFDSPYTASKYAAEQILARHAGGGLRYTTLRFGSVFGAAPSMQYETAVNAFVERAAKDGQIPVWKTAMAQVRPYTDIIDATAAMFFCVANDDFNGETYNVCTENRTTSEVLRLIQKRFPKSTIVPTPHERMNTYSYAMDDTAFRARGFTSTGSLIRGINEVADTIPL